MRGVNMAIHIKNQHRIKNLQINNFKDINIFTGDNNTGKTSILEVLNSLKSLLDISWIFLCFIWVLSS